MRKVSEPAEDYCLLPAPSVESFDGKLEWFVGLMRSDPDQTLGEARSEVVNMLRSEEDVKPFVKAYDKLIRERAKSATPNASLDEVCMKSRVARSIVVGAITRVLDQMHREAGKLAVTAVCLRNAPKVADTMVRAALNVETGHRDRRLMMEALHVVDKAGGPTVNVRAEANNSTVNADKAVVVMGGKALPSFEDGTRRMGAALRAIRSSDEEPAV